MDLDGRRVMNLTCYDVEISVPETLFLFTQCYIINSFIGSLVRLVACFKYYKSYLPYYSIISHKYSCPKAIRSIFLITTLFSQSQFLKL